MAQFRVRLVDGGERTVVAQRVVTDHDSIVFENRGADAWTVIHEVPHTQVDIVQRRVVEFSGMARWITERPAAPAGSR